MNNPIVFANLMDKFDFEWSSSCWIWNRYKIKDGYGRLTFKNRQVLAHRLSKYLFGDFSWDEFINPKIIVMHSCDKPSCINPRHLIIGTQKENIADRSQKGRTAKHLERRDRLGRFK